MLQYICNTKKSLSRRCRNRVNHNIKYLGMYTKYSTNDVVLSTVWIDNIHPKDRCKDKLYNILTVIKKFMSLLFPWAELAGQG